MGLGLAAGVPFIASLMGSARIPADLFLETVAPGYFFDGDQHWIAAEGPEVVLNGGFDSDTIWTKGAGAVIANGYLEQNSSGAGFSFAPINLTPGKLYEFSATISNGGFYGGIWFTGPTSTALTIFGNMTTSASRFYFFACTTTAVISFSANTGTAARIDNVSIREVMVGDLGTNLAASGYTLSNGGTGLLPTENPAGTLNLTGGGGGAGNFSRAVKQITGLTVGRHYRIVFLCSGNFPSIFVGTTSAGIETFQATIPTGTSAWEFTATATTHWLTFNHSQANLASIACISFAEWTPRPTLRPATFRDCYEFTCGSDTARTYIDSAGIMRTMDYGRTNLFNYSQDFPTGWALTNGGNTITVASNVATAPDGTLTADRITSGAGSGANDAAQTVSQTGLMTLSAYFKAEAPGTIVHIRTTDFTSGGTHVNLDLDTGVVALLTYQQGTTSQQSASAENVGNGWYRLRLTQRFNSGASFSAAFGLSPNMTFESGAVPSGTTVLVWGMQAEWGKDATAYKPTGATSVRGGIDAPRYTWNPGRNKMDLVLEYQVTNIRANGQSPTFTFPLGGVTRVAEQPDPMGTNEAVRLDFLAGIYTADYDINIGSSIALRRWNRSIWMRADTPCSIAFRIASIGGIQNTIRLVHISTQWQRFENLDVLFGASRTETGLTIGLDNRALFGADQLAKSIYVFGDQVEEYGYSTSTILTPNSATVTRLVETDAMAPRLRALHELLPGVTMRTQARLRGFEPGPKRVKGTTGGTAATLIAANTLDNSLSTWNGAVDIAVYPSTGTWTGGASGILALNSQGRAVSMNGVTAVSDINVVSRVPPFYLGRDGNPLSGSIPIFGDGSYMQDALWPFRGANASLPAATPIPAGVPINLFPKSEAFDDASWTKNNMTVTANAVANPLNGRVNADKIVPNGTNTGKGLDGAAFTSGVAQPYTFSVYAKADAYGFIQLRTNVAFGTDYANFDLTAGVLGTKTAGATNHTITPIGGGWYRCSCTIIPASSVSGLFVLSIVGSASATRAPNFIGNTTDGVLLYRAQLQTGTAVSYYAGNL